ncbi:MAG TPA: serine hydrolase domain-containing protein [Rhizomicrobium sp.]|nr:serine hydrolase domain-containing protein [Rhizomicrobium sp.]
MDVTPGLDGHCDPRFVAVREAFRENLAARGDPGAAVSVARGGSVVVDLWGGFADAARERAWQRHTLVNFFSVSKALCTICALRQVEQGRLELDAPVARVWPEFAAGGKAAITLRQILCHQSGLPSLREPMLAGAMLDWAAMTGALARAEPWWTPGTAHGYHVNTFGFLLGEIVRRVDGRSIGAVLRDEVAGPLGADVHIGLPDSEHARAAEFLWPAASSPSPAQGMPSAEDAMRFNAYWNPPGISGGGHVNTPQWRRAEIPSTNGHGTARGVARVYAALANGGEIDGVRILSRAMLDEATREHANGIDLISQRPSRFGLGFQLTQAERPLGPNPRAFGHFGAGGSLGFCDPDAGIAFGYVTSGMGPRWQNPRNRALIDALYSSLR